MKLILPDGRELPAKHVSTARLDAIIELQLQGGSRCSAENLRKNIEASSMFAGAALYFLTLASAGEKVKWADVLAMTPEDLGRVKQEPGDPGYVDPDAEPGTEAGEAPDPTEGADATAPLSPTA